MHDTARPMALGVKVVIALLIGFVIAIISGVMYEVTIFLFYFSGGQSRMGPVVNYGALVVIAATVLFAAIVWRKRSPTTAAISAAIGTPVAWVAAIVVEWGISFELGAG